MTLRLGSREERPGLKFFLIKDEETLELSADRQFK
jgi:hypothetical protein